MLLVWQWIPKVAWSSDWLLFKGRAAFLCIFCTLTKTFLGQVYCMLVL